MRRWVEKSLDFGDETSPSQVTAFWWNCLIVMANDTPLLETPAFTYFTLLLVLECFWGAAMISFSMIFLGNPDYYWEAANCTNAFLVSYTLLGFTLIIISAFRVVFFFARSKISHHKLPATGFFQFVLICFLINVLIQTAASGEGCELQTYGAAFFFCTIVTILFSLLFYCKYVREAPKDDAAPSPVELSNLR